MDSSWWSCQKQEERRGLRSSSQYLSLYSGRLLFDSWQEEAATHVMSWKRTFLLKNSAANTILIYSQEANSDKGVTINEHIYNESLLNLILKGRHP